MFNMCKGSSTYAYTGTTSTPYLFLIELRVKYLILNIFNTFFQFREVGDEYLG